MRILRQILTGNGNDKGMLCVKREEVLLPIVCGAVRIEADIRDLGLNRKCADGVFKPKGERISQFTVIVEAISLGENDLIRFGGIILSAEVQVKIRIVHFNIQFARTILNFALKASARQRNRLGSEEKYKTLCFDLSARNRQLRIRRVVCVSTDCNRCTGALVLDRSTGNFQLSTVLYDDHYRVTTRVIDLAALLYGAIDELNISCAAQVEDLARCCPALSVQVKGEDTVGYSNIA